MEDLNSGHDIQNTLSDRRQTVLGDLYCQSNILHRSLVSEGIRIHELSNGSTYTFVSIALRMCNTFMYTLFLTSSLFILDCFIYNIYYN